MYNDHVNKTEQSCCYDKNNLVNINNAAGLNRTNTYLDITDIDEKDISVDYCNKLDTIVEMSDYTELVNIEDKNCETLCKFYLENFKENNNFLKCKMSIAKETTFENHDYFMVLYVTRNYCDITYDFYMNVFNDTNKTGSTSLNQENITFDSDSLADHELDSLFTSSCENSLNSTFGNNLLSNNINIMCLNCCGIKSRLKYPEFGNLIEKYDIICLVETKTDDLDVIDFPGYKFSMKNRKKVSHRRSGGIMVGYKNTLSNMIEIKKY